MGNISLTPSVSEALIHGYSVSDKELLATLFGKNVAAQILNHFGTFNSLAQAGIEELKELKGVGEKKATQIKAIVEFARRLYQKPLDRGQSITSSQVVFDAYAPLLKGRLQESFWILLLDVKNRVKKHVQLHEGTMWSCSVEIKDIFRYVLKEGATGVILLHNHPSGDPTPSQEDINLTRKVSEFAEMIGVRVLDHIVIGDNEYCSFLDSGIQF